ncbi:tagaturonate reductase [Chitinophaga arvensicola]|uniref:Tagaturonate reductase n=1 Tax=Chitinophaga arvensicola TaxID=29529 RepID=A0A1I0S9B1_9BACT|nr:tagaturonate reductase [Chitinophaga arvensicola]SEW52650.1 tagaturonate reductase [Chitinophaga arvensicola]
MKLSEELLPRLHEKEAARCLHLPEKVLQFGTGVLLRGLPDFFIDKANKQGIFNGRIVVIKSTANGSTDAFAEQDNLYTHCIRGIADGKPVAENIINASISRVLNAASQWEEILACATNPDMEVVISNTTEIGIIYQEESIQASPPQSFPGKLLAFLYHRYIFFKGDVSKGLVIIPTELIPDNGHKLRDILLQLSAFNRLEPGFVHWLQYHNDCCNSLVDCIVPGAADIDTGYEDELIIMTEVYRLWAIETDSERVKRILSFHTADAGVVLAPDINVFRELKLRLLNGTHTLSCGLAVLAGLDTVKAAMNNPPMAAYIKGLMIREIIPSITDTHIRAEDALRFAEAVLDRFRNPAIEHRWLSICGQYTAKLKMRVVPVLLQHYQRSEHVPELMALGFAAHTLFMRGGEYVIADEQAAWYRGQWAEYPPDLVVKQALSNSTLWGHDLSLLPGFAAAVAGKLKVLQEEGAAGCLEQVMAAAKAS